MQTCSAGAVAGLVFASGSSADLSAEMRFRRGRPCLGGGAGSEEVTFVMSDQDHLLGDQQFFGGVDWGGSFHQLCVLDHAGEVVVQQRTSHDVAGLALLAEQLAGLCSPVAMAIERAEGLLVEFLHTLPGLKLYCVSPKISARARERYRLSASKSDSFDAFVLADTLRHEHRRWRPLSHLSSLTAELQAVSRDRQRVLHAKVACESRLRAVLETYHPAPLHLFSELDGDISLEFIRAYPTPDQARRVKTAQMAAFCARQHYSGRTDPAVLVDRLTPHLLGASAGTTAGRSFSARLFAEELRMHTGHLRAFDKRLNELLQVHPDAPIFLSFPGIGPVVGATLISEMGDDAPGSLRQMRCWRRPDSPQSPRPPAAPGRSGSAMPRTGGFGTSSTGGPSWPAAKTPGPRSFTRTHGAAAKANTGPCAVSAPAGLASCGAAGPTTAATTRPDIPGQSCSPPDPAGSGTTA
jgi:hypothetical protein